MKTRRFFREWEKENLNSDGKKKTGERMKQTFQCQCWQTLATNWRAELLTKKMWPTLGQWLLSSVFYPLQKLKRTGRVSLLWLAGGGGGWCGYVSKWGTDTGAHEQRWLCLVKNQKEHERPEYVCVSLFSLWATFSRKYFPFFFLFWHIFQNDHEGREWYKRGKIWKREWTERTLAGKFKKFKTNFGPKGG